MIRLLLFLMFAAFPLFHQNWESIHERIINDETLVVPGMGAEKIIIHEPVAILNSTYQGLDYRLAKVGDNQDVFRDILKINNKNGIVFNEIRYFYGNNVVVFIKNNIVQSVAGMNTDRITLDSVDLGRGASYFVFNYGNESLTVYKKPNGYVYIYAAKGIAVFDDDNDDSIDLYMVFPAVNRIK